MSRIGQCIPQHLTGLPVDFRQLFTHRGGQIFSGFHDAAQQLQDFFSGQAAGNKFGLTDLLGQGQNIQSQQLQQTLHRARQHG